MKSRIFWALLLTLIAGGIIVTPIVLRTAKVDAEQRAADAAPPEVKAAVAAEEALDSEAMAYLTQRRARVGAISPEDACEISDWRRRHQKVYEDAGSNFIEAMHIFITNATNQMNPADQQEVQRMVKEAMQVCLDHKKP